MKTAFLKKAGKLWLSCLFLFLTACDESVLEVEKLPARETLREIESGKIIGFRDNSNTFAWLGIPYAKAPVGDLRWKAPQKEMPWSGVRESLEFQSYCPQIAGLGIAAPKDLVGKVAGSEDCLYLNVWAPNSVESNNQLTEGVAGLPVMLWIHGGGNTVGTANSYSKLSTLSGKQKVVVVSINYRLGLLGWFRHPALMSTQLMSAKEGKERSVLQADLSGNYGTLDIIQSLHWVKNNIAAFGGDPENVTVFGESAGGFNVYSLMLSPLAEGLFHKAISQSGGIKVTPINKAENYRDDLLVGDNFSAKEIAILLAIEEGLAKSRSEAKQWLSMQADSSLSAWLKGKTVDQLFSIFNNNDYPMGMLPVPYLFSDGYVLPKHDIKAILKMPSLFNSVPLMTGTNRDEMKLFMMGDNEFTKKWFGVVPSILDKARYNRTARYKSDLWRILGADLPATLLSQRERALPVFTYRFDFDQLKDNWLVSLSELLGASHGLEMAYVFGLPGSLSNNFNVHTLDTLEFREKLAYAMSSYWTNFSYTGSPGRGRLNDLPLWQAWDNQEGGAKAFLIDADNRGGLRQITKQLSIESLKADMINDQELIKSQKALCETYYQVFKQSILGEALFNEKEYKSFGQEGCSLTE